MDPYDLALRLLGLLGSSTAAILQTIKGVIKRLEQMENTQDELAQWQEIQAVAESITQDAKATELLTVLKQGFALIKKVSAKRKAVIFTESVETQKMLQRLLSQEYTTLSYNGSTDYSVIRRFKEEGEVLISTDNGAKGFNLEDSAFVVHYDLLYNTLKMEQRTGKPCKVPSRGWVYPNPNRMKEEIERGRVVFGKDESTTPKIRTNLFEQDTEVLRSVHFSYAQTATQEFNKLFDGVRIFENPKNPSDIKKLVEYITAKNDSDIILDFFSGSATTAHAVMQLMAN